MQRLVLFTLLFVLALGAQPRLDLDGIGLLSKAMAQSDDDDDDDDDRDDDDDDDDDRGDGGRSSGGTSFSGRSGDRDDDDRRRATPRRAAPRQAAPAPVRRAAPARAPAPAPLPDRAADEIIARGVSADDLAQLQTDGFVLIEQRALTGGANLVRLRKPGPLDLDAARAAVRARASGTSADFNHFYRTDQGAAQPADACPGGLCLARQVIAWQPIAGCGPLPAVGMVDTGVNADHATFAQADLTVHSLDPAAERARATASDALHGTAVAALLVGAPDTRSPGLIPGARLVAVDAFVRQGQDQRSDAFSLIAALDWLGAQDLRLINMSLAGPPNDELARQIALLVARDVLIVAAAGNVGPRAAPAYPAAYDGVLAVTAVDRGRQIYRRAGRGPHIDLAAPGVEVWTAASISGARTKTGTSFAAPFVTAAAALWLRAEPALSAADLARRLTERTEDLGDPGRDEVFGAGLLQAPPPCGGAG
ncbi:S8 family serine peptidase [Paracoccus hibiscisoli]|nr:S8 family serine peptidase [Paracoccus hibiscisoli]